MWMVYRQLMPKKLGLLLLWLVSYTTMFLSTNCWFSCDIIKTHKLLVLYILTISEIVVEMGTVKDVSF